MVLCHVYVWQKQKQEHEERGTIFLLFFSSPDEKRERERPRGQYISTRFLLPSGSISLCSFFLVLSLSLPSSRTKSAREKFSEITQPSLPPSDGSFDARARFERERESEARTNSPSPDRYLVEGSLCHSLAHSHTPRRSANQKKTNSYLRVNKNERYTRTLATVRFLNWPETAENCVSWVVCEEKQRLASSRGTGTSAFPNRGEEKKKSQGVHNESDYTSIFTRVFFFSSLKIAPKNGSARTASARNDDGFTSREYECVPWQ